METQYVRTTTGRDGQEVIIIDCSWEEEFITAQLDEVMAIIKQRLNAVRCDGLRPDPLTVELHHWQCPNLANIAVLQDMVRICRSANVHFVMHLEGMVGVAGFGSPLLRDYAQSDGWSQLSYLMHEPVA